MSRLGKKKYRFGMHPDRVQECRSDGSLYLLLRHRTCTFTMWSYVDVVATLYVLFLHLNFITGGRCLWRRGEKGYWI